MAHCFCQTPNLQWIPIQKMYETLNWMIYECKLSNSKKELENKVHVDNNKNKIPKHSLSEEEDINPFHQSQSDQPGYEAHI